MKRWSYTLPTVLLALGALLIQHAPAHGDDAGSGESADTAPARAQTADDDFVPSEKLPADAAISFPVDI